MFEEPKTAKVRIGILMHGVFYGGATRSLFLLLKSLQNESFEFIIYTIKCSSDDIKKELLKYAIDFRLVKLKTISVNQVYSQSLISYQINKRSNCNSFINRIIQDKIDILHINTTVFPQIPQLVKEKTNIKVIVHLREWLSPATDGVVQRYMIKKIINYTDALIAISENEAVMFYQHPNIHILPNPFDFKNLTKSKKDFRPKNKIPEDKILVCMFSHFSQAKGHLNFLKALKILTHKLTDHNYFKFVIVGYHDKRTWYKLLIKKILFMKDYTQVILNFISKNNLHDKVILIPYTDDVFTVMDAIDIVVRPADSADPWGRDVIEAMAFGKPVVATGSSEFFILNANTGFLVPPKNPERLAESIEKLIISKNLRVTFGKAAFDNVYSKCNIKQYTISIKSIYQSLTIS